MQDEGFVLDGRRALVTGASTGIGAAIAARLARAGAHVIAVSRSGTAPEQEGVDGLSFDLADPAQVERVVGAAVEVLGGLDIVVNNAGAADHRRNVDIDRAHFDRLVDLNLWAPLRISQLAHPYLVESDDAAIVNIGSIDATRPSASGLVYGATKAALAATTKALAKDWMDDGIRVNQVDPGLIDTPLAAGSVAAVREADARINIVGRVGTPDEIAGLVHYLVAPVGRFANGASFLVDGGALALGPFDSVKRVD